MLALCVLMIVCAATALALAAIDEHRRVLALASEFTMLVAMVDVCLLGSRLLPAVVWSAALLACAIARAPGLRAETAGRFSSAVHLGGLILTSALLLLAGGSAHRMTGGTDIHHGAAGSMIPFVAIAVIAYVAAEATVTVQTARARKRSGWRRTAGRAGAASASAVAMFAMVILGS
ncbi:MAG: hypothetical protein JWQ43_2664 [Glaciihabitans sp.]|nr:hypothetical protein [Glaciihabitans sp.]